MLHFHCWCTRCRLIWIGSKRKPDSSKEEHPNNDWESEKIWRKSNSKIPTNMEKRIFLVKFDEEKKEMFCIVCRKYPTPIKRAGFMSASMVRPTLVFAVILLWVTRRATLITFVFNKLKMKKNQSRRRCSE